ncbi:MAG TPA: MarR family transcriptional regulator [Solirubrobacterales bacterium]|jgi:DNA-binding MarR family transcriptional regulator|nr:MarR family transcriptional regulator [Solirubrobacterales bacterium]
MQASHAKIVAEQGPGSTEIDDAARDTAARVTALMHHVFLYDRGSQLRVIEGSGLNLTQCKVLLEIGGLGGSAQTWQVGDLAELFGVSVPSMSRAVESLVKAGLVTRLEDPEDRRVRLVGITPKGKDLVAELVTVKQAGVAAFATTLSATQRRKLDAAVDALMEREDIAKTYEHLKGSDVA